MKVLMVTPSYYPIIGGTEALTRLISAKLNEMGIQTDIMTFNMDIKWNPVWNEETTTDGQSQVFRISAVNPFPKLPNFLFPLFRMNVIPKLSFLKKFKDYDIIDFVGEPDLAFPIFSMLLKKPKVFHCAGIFPTGGIYEYYMSKHYYLRKFFMKFFSNIADKFVMHSPEEKTLLKDLGVPVRKIENLPLIIDTALFRPDETKKVDNLLVFVGRLYPIKGVHLLLEALHYVDTPVELVIIGPRWDETYVKKLEQMAHEINKKSVHKVKLLGAMGQKDLVQWYQQASLLVTPYLFETYNTVTLEALACGTPVVSTGTHILDQASDGILVTPKDSKKLAAAISKFLNDKELREKYGAEGIKFINEHFSVEVVIKKLVKIYSGLLENEA